MTLQRTTGDAGGSAHGAKRRTVVLGIDKVRPAVWLWALFLGSHAAYALLRTWADELLPAQTLYAAAADRAIFAGEVPTLWLQRQFYGGLPLAWWEWYLVVIFFSVFAAPVILAGLLTVTRARVLPVFMTAMALAHAIALAGHALVPTSPPWLVGLGADFPDVHRILHEVLFNSNAYTTGLMLSPNDVAAMPSLHMAATAIVAFAVMRLGKLGVLWGWIYIISMLIGLVYLGEHFVVDAVAGLLTGGLAWAIANMFWQRRQMSGGNGSSSERWSRVTRIPGEPVGGMH